MNKLIKLILILFSLTLLVIFLCNFWVIQSSKNKLYNDLHTIPHNKVGLVLGTSKFLTNRKLNPYFKSRLDAAILLYNNKKIDVILVSGDNRKVNYNEPKQMTLYLLKRNIPENKIIQDYGGRRTLDSVLRANSIFDLTKFTIISQQFHNERAVFIANRHGLNVVAFNAKAINLNSFSIKNTIRESFAKVKAVLDIILQVKPEIGGKKEPILVSN